MWSPAPGSTRGTPTDHAHDARPGDAGRSPAPPPLRGIRTVVLLIGGIVTVAALYLGRDFLVPVAAAGLLTFVLSPSVRQFERWMPRALAATLVVVLAALLLGAFASAVALQAASLGKDIPAYRDNIKRKIAEVRGASRGSVIEKVQSASKEIVEELQKGDPGKRAGEKPVLVEPRVSWRLPALLSALAKIGLVLTLVIFMLIERLQIRDGLIRLMGFGRIATTTKAMDEAAQRITRYLTMQTLVNGTFGLGVALVAWLVGLPYEFLWGSLAAVLRFIPYVGPWAGGLGVAVAGLAVFDTWLRPLVLVGLFVALELFVSLVLEMYLYSQSAGVSQVALLLAVAFWTWVWGPVGLALATPLTVCLVVLTKYIPSLEVVSMLMSDEPVMSPARTYYQRLVAQDESEAAVVVQDFVESHPREEIHDAVFVPALIQAQRDYKRGWITDDDLAFVERATRDLVEELDRPPSPAEPLPGPAVAILGLPAQDEVDELALLMLKQHLDPRRFAVDIASPNLLAGEAIATVEAHVPAAILVGALAGPGRALQVRYLCKRLRARFPDLPLAVGWWGGDGSVDAPRDAMVSAVADRVAVSLADAGALLQELASTAPMRQARGSTVAAAR